VEVDAVRVLVENQGMSTKLDELLRVNEDPRLERDERRKKLDDTKRHIARLEQVAEAAAGKRDS